MLRVNSCVARADVCTVLGHDILSVLTKHAGHSHGQSFPRSSMRLLMAIKKNISGKESVSNFFSAIYPPLLVTNHLVCAAPRYFILRNFPRRLGICPEAITKAWCLDINKRSLHKKGCFYLDQYFSRLLSFNVPKGSNQSDAGTEAIALEQEKEAKAKMGDTELKLFNTMTKQKEIFQPKVTGKISMYVCGVTPYDYSHIGHARVYVAFDVLYRYLKFLDFEVTYVRNFTDIDDKIINRAKELGEEPMHLSGRFCEEFHVDMDALQCLPPSAEPRVTNYVDRIVAMIEQIVENGYGYVVEGDVYFAVDTYTDYGRLSGRKLDENRAGERVAVDERKQNPADFALWKSAKPGEPSWESPWGRGRPGWHIECSAMSATLLGHSFDIHGGGMDLIFPHHENEIAQSFAACQHSHVSFWMHNGFVTINEEKMSKSLGNFFTIREVMEQYHPMALRWFLLGTHYRSPVNFSRRQLDSATDRVYYLYQTLEDCCHHLVEEVPEKDLAAKSVADCITKLRTVFTSSMSDDLHTPAVVAALSEPLKLMNDLLHTGKGKKDKSRFSSLHALHKEVTAILDVLGFSVSNYSQVLAAIKEKALKRSGLSEEDLLKQIQHRAAARASKDYKLSDQIRADLASLGIALMDGDRTLWRPCMGGED